MITATPTKLRNGNWGAKVQTSNIHTGDQIRITTRAGKTWTATVERVVWSGQGVAIVATGTGNTTRRASRPVDAGCGYPCPVTGRRCHANDLCHDCQ